MTDREAMQQALKALEYAAERIGCPDDDDAIGVARKALRERLARPETIIDKSAAIRIATALGWEPRREWVGLTDEELEVLEIKHAPPVHPDVKDDDWWEFAQAIEAKLREKNT